MHHSPPESAEAAQAKPIKQEQQRATTDITEVAPGVLRSQLPIDMPGLGHVNCYLLEDERGLAIVDPGLPGPEPWNALVDRLGRAGYRVADVHTVIVTHSHLDHFGGANRMRYETGADIVAHEAFRTLFDQAVIGESEDSSALAVNTAEERLAAIEQHIVRPNPWGGHRQPLSPDFVEQMRAGHATHGARYEPLQPTLPLVEGRTIRLARREWVTMHTPGHTFDHVCLYDPEFGVVFTGDHVLPSITPHISGLSPQTDPLAHFFESLARMAGMNGVSVALPAHGHPFTDLRARSEQIIEHHGERLDVIRQATHNLTDGTVNDFMRVLFRERSWGDMAESETFAHLEHLRLLGELERTDVDGWARYRLVG